MASTDGVFCMKTNWRGRAAYALGNGTIRLVTLLGGGHIAELRFEESTGLPTMSPLWAPPWPSIEPYHYRPEIHARIYGSSTEGKLLSGIAGHNLCLDYFGSPSPEEARQGLSQHGEAPSAKWRKVAMHVTGEKAILNLSVRLPVAGLLFSREITVRKKESIVYFKETVLNETKLDHFFHWTQHVTLGPPFLARGASRISVPATRGKTFPHGYDEGKALLAPNREFRWPHAPDRHGKLFDLRPALLKKGLGFVVGMLLERRRAIQFVTATNNKIGLLIGYCFRHEDFPFVAVWEENRAISAMPWKRRTEARGIEFSSNPLPVTRREAFAMGSFFGHPMFTCVPSRGRIVVRYVAFLSGVDQGFGELRDLGLSRGKLLLYGTNSRKPLALQGSALGNSLGGEGL